jgi:hypothetical protein
MCRLATIHSLLTACVPCYRVPRTDRLSVDHDAGVAGGSDGEDSSSRRMIRYPDNQQVFVGNLPHIVTDMELRDFFESKSPELAISDFIK